MAAVPLWGCVSNGDFDGLKEGFKGSPALQDRFVERCTERMHLTSSDRQDLAALMNVASDADVPKIGCRRVANAMASGRMTYDDYNSMIRGEVRPSTVRILQGR